MGLGSLGGRKLARTSVEAAPISAHAQAAGPVDLADLPPVWQRVIPAR